MIDIDVRCLFPSIQPRVALMTCLTMRADRPARFVKPSAFNVETMAAKLARSPLTDLRRKCRISSTMVASVR